MIRPVRLTALAGICSIFLIACGGSGNDPTDSNAAGATTAAGHRLITLSPHLAELVFAVGAGEMLVGVSAYTDYPEHAAELPIVGDAFNLDQERLALLAPDLLLAWKTGTPAHVIDELKARGHRVVVIETTGLADIADALRQIGRLVDRSAQADKAALEFEHGLAAFRKEASGAGPISVYYQIAARPLYTINSEHYLSELIDVCGGTNIFADLGNLAPLIGVEAVLERNPEVMLAASDAGPEAFDEWQRWPDIAANRYDNRFIMPADIIGRATPRLLLAAEAVCDALEQGRENRDRYSSD